MTSSTHHINTLLILDYLLFPGQSTLKKLLLQANDRQQHAYTKGTNSNHKSQIYIYLEFCHKLNQQPLDPDRDTVLAYVEYLCQHLTSYKSIRNYFSAINFLHNSLEISFSVKDCFPVQLLLRAAKLTVKEGNRRKLPITIQQLTDIINYTSQLGDLGTLIKVGICFSFFGFLRQSNIAPKSASEFDIMKHTTRGDIEFREPGLVISIRWSKTKQAGEQPHLVPLSKLTNKTLCPVRAYKKLLKVSPTHHSNQPLLSLSASDVLSAHSLSSHFKHIVSQVGLNPTHYSLHSLRRGGALAAVQGGASLVSAKIHGDWRSEAIWDYLVAQTPEHSQVAQVFRSST